MRRAYVEAHHPLRQSFSLATEWAHGQTATLIGPSTSAIDAEPWVVRAGLPIGVTSSRRSRFKAPPHGTVIAWCLNLDEILSVESRSDVDGIVAIRAHTAHAPWITAHNAERLGGEPITPVPEATAAIKAMVEGITLLPVLNQGLIDSRERSMAVQALTYLRDRGHGLDPQQLVVEAIRQGWPDTSPLDLAKIATDLNAGKRLRFQPRLSPIALAEWANA